MSKHPQGHCMHILVREVGPAFEERAGTGTAQ